MQKSTTVQKYLIDYDKTQAFVVYDAETMVRVFALNLPSSDMVAVTHKLLLSLAAIIQKQGNGVLCALLG